MIFHINTKKYLNVILKLGVFTLLLLLPSQTYAATLSKPSNNLGLVGYWSFNDATSTTATDFSGNDNHGTLNNMANPATATSGWGTGKIGSGLNFDGINDYISVPSGVSGVNGQSQLTISGWVKRGSASSYGALFDKKQSNGSWIIAQFHSTGVYFVVSSNSAYARLTTPSSLDWLHYTFVYNGAGSTNADKMKIYVNGVEQSVSIVGTIPTTTASPVATPSIGFDVHNTAYMNAKIDEVRIYNRALSATEVMGLYNAGQTRFKQAVSGSGLVAHWKLDEATSTIAGDSSGRNNTGTIYNISQPSTSASGWKSGKIGSAIKFDGVNDYIDLGTRSDFAFGTGAFSVSGWYKLDTIGATSILMSFAGSNTGQGVIAVDSTRDLLYYALGYRITTSPVAPVVGKWEFFTLVGNGGPNGSRSVSLYKNGVLSGTWVNDYNWTSAQWHMGMNGSYSPELMRGDLDDIRVYNRALSTNEIVTLYNTGGQRINASQTRTNTSLDSGLVGMWSFDGRDVDTTTAFDRSGNSNNGTLMNGPTPTIGKVGQAINFDGVDDYVSPTTTGFPSGNSAITYSAWVKPASNGFQVMVYYGDNATNQGYYLHQGNTASGYFGVGAYGGDINIATSPYVIGQWYHLVAVYDGSTSKLYVDGVLNSTVAKSNLSLTNSYANIGRYSGAGGLNFNGSIDEVRIYNRALRADEVKLLYNLGK